MLESFSGNHENNVTTIKEPLNELEIIYPQYCTSSLLYHNSIGNFRISCPWLHDGGAMYLPLATQEIPNREVVQKNKLFIHGSCFLFLISYN
jgi:hypothetical protein